VRDTLGSGLILLLTMAGAAFGCWGREPGGGQPTHSRLRGFERDINEGHILLMVNVSKGRVFEITELVRGHHPGAEDRGIDSTIPAFP
jgi:hypothetical protein